MKGMIGFLLIALLLASGCDQPAEISQGQAPAGKLETSTAKEYPYLGIPLEQLPKSKGKVMLPPELEGKIKVEMTFYREDVGPWQKGSEPKRLIQFRIAITNLSGDPVSVSFVPVFILKTASGKTLAEWEFKGPPGRESTNWPNLLPGEEREGSSFGSEISKLPAQDVNDIRSLAAELQLRSVKISQAVGK